MRRKTNKEWLIEIKNLVGNSYVAVSDYQGSKIPVAFYHVYCSHVFYMSPNAFLRGQRCPFCAKIKRGIKRTYGLEWFTKQLHNKYGHRYRIAGKYVNTKTPVKIRCTQCNRAWHPIPNNILRGYGCPYCSGRIVTQEDFNKRIKLKNDGQFIFLDSYRGIDKKIRCHCKNCNYTWPITPHDFYQIKGCPMCQTNHVYNTKEYRVKLAKIYGDEYSLLGRYIPNKKLWFIHNVCLTKFLANPADMLIRNTGCPTCNQSKGEFLVQRLLKNMGIYYISQYKFLKCKLERPLPFDFYLPEERIAIEYDGIQHYRKDHFNRSVDEFMKAQLRDKIKDWYCQSHNIHLIRIPYTAKKLEQIKKYLYIL